MDEEKSIINCKHCGQTKTRILAGTYPNRKDKKWVDENGNEFNGRTCPDCHRSKVAQRKRLGKKNSYV